MARPRQVTDEEILAAARACFLEHGPGVALTVVAEQLGISQPALFKRFGTKKKLLIAALAPRVEAPFFPWLRRGPDDRPLEVQLLELAALVSGFFREMIPCVAALRSSGVNPEELLLKQPEPMPLRARRLMTLWMEQARERGLIRADMDCDAAATALLGALQVRPFMAHVAGEALSDSEPDAYLNAVVGLMVDGLGTRA